MKKILHVINMSRFGGVEMLFKQYLLESEGGKTVEHHIVLDRNMIHPEMISTINKVAASIRFVKLGVNWKIPFLYSFRARELINKVNPDKVLLWNCYKPVLPAIQALSDQYDFEYYDHGALLLSRSQETFATILSKLSRVIVGGEAIKRIFEIKYPNANVYCSIVYNGVAFDSSNEVKKSFVLGKSVNIGIAAHLRPIKGHALLFHSIALLKKSGFDVVLHVAGVGPQEQYLRTLVAKLGIESAVKFLGFVKAMPDFYKKMDVVVLPSFSETFGLALVEAMAYGCVPIAPAVNDFHSVVNHGVNGFCLRPTLSLAELAQYDQSTESLPKEVYDPASDQLQEPKGLDPIVIAEAIKTLVSNPEMFSRMGQNAMIDSRSKYNLQRYVGTLNETLFATEYSPEELGNNIAETAGD